MAEKATHRAQAWASAVQLPLAAAWADRATSAVQLHARDTAHAVEHALTSAAAAEAAGAPIEAAPVRHFLLSPPAGSKVIAVATDFPAITRPWLRLETTGRCVVDFVADRPDSDLTTDVMARIDADTSVVAIGWVQYATGGGH